MRCTDVLVQSFPKLFDLVPISSEILYKTMVDTILATKAGTVSFEDHASQLFSEVKLCNTISDENIVRITVRRNDAMKNRIEDIMKALEQGSRVLVIGGGEAVAKLVSVVEIVKLRTASVKQHNRLTLITEEVKCRPNHGEASTKSEAEDALNEAADHKKVIQRPVLSVLLTHEDDVWGS